MNCSFRSRSQEHPHNNIHRGYAVNLKGARILTETYGINSSSFKCSSHLASGTIPRMCTSVNSTQGDATSLYDNLKAPLKHFTMSPKSTEFLNNALNALELSSVHMLNWASARMAGFMDACVQASEILIPFLDTLVAGNIRPDETKFIASPKGVYLIQLFADLQCIFTDSYLHHVDSDSVLICETYNVAQKTVQTLLNEELKTPNADALLEGLHSDRNQNIMADIKMKDAVHTVTLNSKVTRGVTLDKVKEKLVKSKMEILQCMDDNILSLNDNNGSLAELMSAFDLSSEEDYEARASKVMSPYDVYCQDRVHDLEEWNGFKVKVNFPKRIDCTKSELLSQLKKGFEKMNCVARKLRDDKKLKKEDRKLSQVNKLLQ